MKIVNDVEIKDLFPLIDKRWLFTGIWQLKGGTEEGEMVLGELRGRISEYRIEPKFVFERFKSQYEKGSLILYSDGEEELVRFEFNDVIFNKFSKSQPVADEVALLCATVGDKVKEAIDERRIAAEYKYYFYLNGLAAALAEALTEYGHREICQELEWERGKSFRLSPGYPAWPNLEDQLMISKLLSLDKIGVRVSEVLQLHPEFSTTSMIFRT